MLIMNNNLRIVKLFFFIFLFSCSTSTKKEANGLKNKDIIENRKIKIQIFANEYFIGKEKINDTKKNIDIRYNNESNDNLDSIRYWVNLAPSEFDMPKFAYSLPILELTYDKDSILRHLKTSYLIYGESMRSDKEATIKEINDLMPITKKVDLNNQKNVNKSGHNIVKISLKKGISNSCIECYEFLMDVN